MTIWFTSDTHYFHRRISELCNRPFNSVEEMNESLIELHNKLVKPGDTVYHLGDFAFGAPRHIIEVFHRLNGRYRIIRGNHDKWINKINPSDISTVEWIKDYFEIRENGQVKFVLFHFPISSWLHKYRGSMHLHGHCHGRHNFSWPRSTEHGKIADLGVDCWDYAPVSWDEIGKLFETFKAL